MQDILTPKEVFLSMVAVIVAILLLWVMDLGLFYLLNNVILDVLNWFNNINWVYKALIIILGGVSIFIILFQVITVISGLIGGFIFDKLPDNLFTKITTGILALANAGWLILKLWKLPTNYNFWVICELIILSIFIWALCIVVVPLKSQKKEE